MTAALSERARREGTPLIDGDGLTWVWLERGPPPTIFGDFSKWDPDDAPRWRRRGDAWVARLDAPRDAYLEYALLDAEGRRVRDPLNGARIGNGIGDWNHRAWMPDAPRAAHDLARRRRLPFRAGTVTEHVVEPRGLAVGKRRRVWLHRPTGRDAEPLPLLVALDGNSYLRAKADRLIDSLVAGGRMRPVVTAFVENAGVDARMVEYMGSEVTVDFLAEHVVSLARREAAAAADPTPGRLGPITIMGPSAAGLMALYAGLRRPDRFGTVLAQAGAWEFNERETIATTLVRNGDPPANRIWMDVGTYDWLLDANDRMAALLGERGCDVTYRRFNAGHNFTAWMEELLVALPALLPPGG